MKTQNFDRVHPDKLQRQIERELKEAQIPYKKHFTGSHCVTQTPKGDIVNPIHGELPKPTYKSILRMLERILATAAVIALGVLSASLVFGF